MANRDFVDNVGQTNLLEYKDYAHTSTKSNVLDTRGFEAVALLISLGAFTGADATNHLDFTMEESDTTNDVDFTTVAAGNLQGAFATVNNTTTATKKNQMVGYIGTKRYIRINGTYTGTGITAGIWGVSGLQTNGAYRPVTAPAAVTAT
jgi:hypothetical protein